MKVHIVTFGCRSNQCDSRWIAESLVKSGCAVVDDVAAAEAVIVNTCTVTAEGERQGRQALRRCRRDNPHAIVIATGCAVQADPAAFLAMPEIDYVADLETRNRLSELIRTFELRSSPTLASPINEVRNCFFASPPDGYLYGGTRAPLKIQDGCDNSCTYCIVSKVRGPSRSMPPDDVISHLEALGRAGRKEVVLTGIHLGGWGRDLEPPRSLESLLRRVLMRKFVNRIRLSSLDPVEVTGELLDLLVTEDGLCPHLHLPLQSGCDEILKAMGRRYSIREASVRIRLVKQAVPEAIIGMDVIVGFPGETDVLFEKSFQNIKEIPFDYLHIFPFSPRPGVPAASIEDRPDDEAVKDRANRLRELAEKRKRFFWGSFLGAVRPVIIESETGDGMWFGHTDNYIPVFFPPGPYKFGDMVPVSLLELEDAGVRGEIST